MSADEELAAVGRIARERGELRRRHAALEQEIASLIRLIGNVAVHFAGMAGTLRFDRDQTPVQRAIDAGGLERLSALLDEYKTVGERLIEVDARANRAGI